jgi:hypothetical protein
MLRDLASGESRTLHRSGRVTEVAFSVMECPATMPIEDV